MANATGRPRGLLIVGTDTGVGKTVIAGALLRLAAQKAFRPIPWKPVETGVIPGTFPPDAKSLLEASRAEIPLPLVCAFPLPYPVAPAAHPNPPAPISILQSRRALLPYGDLFIVESAGGLLSPLSDAYVVADLATALGIPLLLVARNALGTVNHSCLAVAEIRRRRLPLAAMILVNTTANITPDQPHNASLIEAQTGIRPIGPFPFLHGPEPEALARAVAKSCDGIHLLSLAGPFLEGS